MNIRQYCILLILLTMLGCSGPEPVATPTQELPTPLTPTQTKAPPTQAPPTPTAAIPTLTPTPTFEPPAGFEPYEDSAAGIAVYMPDGWIVTNVDPGRFAVLQSYPEDKYVGGEEFQPGDTKCDLNIHGTEIKAADLIDQWKSNPDTTIVSEQEVLLLSGQPGTRIETENRGRALSIVTEVNEKTVALTCFGDFLPFEAIAGTIITSEAIPAVIEPESPSEDTISAVVILAEAGLNLRNGPDTASEVVGVLPKNEIVEVTGASPNGEWWQVTCPEGTLGECWITADPRWSEPVTPLEFSLAGLIYAQLDQQPERPLWRVGADGTPTLFLENSQTLGALSSDGTQVITCCSPRGETNLSLVDLATGEIRQLTNTSDRLNFNPQWWDANLETIVFVSKTVDSNDQPTPGPGNLAVVQIDGTGFQILDDQHEMHTFQPALAPDGQSIAYNHGGENASDDGLLVPWIYDLEDGPTLFNYGDYGLNDLPGLTFGSAAWSPDGQYLAWVIGGELSGNDTWETGIAMFDLEGQSVEVLTPYVPGNCLFVWCREAPEWNATGAWLTWEVSPAGELPSFWTLRPDGTEQEFIDFAVEPVWSPEGNLLVYIQNTSFTTSVIMVMEPGKWQFQRAGLPDQVGIVQWTTLNE